MKILDRYILKSYLQTFFSVLIILMFIFILQSVWLYIRELAGKDLAITVILKFLLYVTPTLIPLILPLTILLASIMVFGSFAEHYEFAAMKSTGISLQRAMRSISVFVLFLAFLTLLFSNYVLPWANFNFYNLRKNIAKEQPAMAIAEGQFNQIMDLNIKVQSKTGNKGQYLHDVIIHQKQPKRRGNYTVIKAKNGEILSDEDSNMLSLKLFDGYYYDEIFSKKPQKQKTKPHVKSKFETHTINVDLADLNEVDYDNKSYNNTYNMLTMQELVTSIDTLKKEEILDVRQFSQQVFNRVNIQTLYKDLRPQTDSMFNGKVLELLTNNQKLQAYNLALNNLNSTNQVIDSKMKSFQNKRKNLNKHIRAFHDKYLLSLACIILFFVGAPLGALIRKGGIGLPLVIAILIFLTYHFIGIFAKNSSNDNSIDPVLATWVSSIILLPFSIYLTSRATKDRGLFNMDGLLVPLKRLFNIKSKQAEMVTDEGDNLFYLKDYSKDQLIAFLKENHKNSHKLLALYILKKQKISLKNITKNLKLKPRFNAILNQYYSVMKWAKLGLWIYLSAALSLVGHFICKNNKLPEVSEGLLYLTFGLAILLAVCLIISKKQLLTFKKFVNQTTSYKSFFMIVLSLPFYPLDFLFTAFAVKRSLDRTLLENIE
ncbi:MAG: LptF/LptG family permease [Flavobacteriaceae bacterium]